MAKQEILMRYRNPNRVDKSLLSDIEDLERYGLDNWYGWHLVPTYRLLLDDLGPIRNKDREPLTRFNAIIVPLATAHTPKSLAKSVRVARLAGAPLIYLCSKDAAGSTEEATAQRVFDNLADAGVDDTQDIGVVHVPKGHPLPGLQLATDTFPVPGDPRTFDIAKKRNLGLALAHMKGWQRILFLDDDIDGIFQLELNHMLNGFEDRPERRVIGWSHDDTHTGNTSGSDHSTAVHALRLLQGTKEPFIGGGAMAVRIPDGERPVFFPDIYNEDWPFFAATQERDGPLSLSRAGGLIQEPRALFGNIGRAIREEWSDTLAEGLLLARQLNLPLRELNSVTVTPFELPFWVYIERKRIHFLTKTKEELEAVFKIRPKAAYQQAHASLTAALIMHENTWPIKLRDFTDKFLDDLGVWDTWLDNLPHFSSQSKNLDYLGLKEFKYGSKIPQHA